MKLYYYFKSIQLVMKTSPMRIWIDLLIQFFVSLENIFLAIFFLRFLIDSVKKGRDYTLILVSLLVISTFMLAYRLIKSWYDNYYRPESDIKISETVKTMMFEKTYNLDRIYYDNPAFYDNYQKATKFIDGPIFINTDSISKIIGNCFMCVSVFSILFTIDPTALIFLIFPLIGIILFEKKLTNSNYQIYVEQVLNHRKKEYVKRCHSERKYAGEIRMTNVASNLSQVFVEASMDNELKIRRFSFRRVSLYFLQELFKNRIPFSIILIYVVYLVIIKRTINAADISVMLLGLVQLSDTFGLLLSDVIKLNEYNSYSKCLFDFMEIKSHIPEDAVGSPIQSFTFSIDIKGLYFGYDRNKPVLKNINMSIKRGQKIAIVGYNGAGKTTLMNLLLRLYIPDSGKIYIDNNDIADITVKDYRNLFSCVFQNFQVLAYSVAENIAFGQENHNGIHSVNDALQFSKLYDKINHTGQGIDSLVTKEFDNNGIELSGGEKQKLAIARAYAKNTPILIFDEPSSALDPIMEDEIYNKILDLGNDKTVIYILHRLSYAKRADVIYCMKDGEIVEAGNHEKLMELKGIYANMYTIQSQSYMDP